MPTLDWIGKAAVVNHHRTVPYRLLKCDAAHSAGDPDAGNLLVQGDNLEALKALLPYYAGRVKCIYIDPPYNTGNENWVYNDNVNSPEIRRWLGQVVGKEAEDLSRHDKWLCMMYPRLALLRDFLAADGSIFVSIADHEIHNLRLVMDEVFGPRNFIACLIWQKVFSPKNSARHFSEDHEYVVVYANDADLWTPNLVLRTENQDERYSNPDNDERGPWTSSDLSARNPYSLGLYPVTCPSGRVIPGPTKGRYWVVSAEKFKDLDADRRIWWGNSGNNMPRLKRFLSDVKQGVVPQTLWPHAEVGHTQEAKKELLGVVDFPDTETVFVTPKPTRLIRRIMEIATDKDSLILDSFAGSGTTGHAVLAQNRADGGKRRLILVELDEVICRDVTAQRLSRVISGHGDTEPLGGGFKYCTLGPPLFDEHGHIRTDDVKFTELAYYVFFAETGVPIPKRATGKTPLLGVYCGKAVYLLFNGILGDRRPDGGNVLTGAVLDTLPPHDGPRVVYGEGCRLGPERLRRARVTFKQIPYALRVE
jgi:site-specific DNA-methyltransferase (adenine-specific)/adenine-specific DNA-methyltransferase